MKVVITGSRAWDDEWLFDVIIGGLLQQLKDEDKPFIVAHGGNRSGADRMAQEWADIFPVVRYPADWEKYGKAAGPRRNKFMLEDFLPDLVLAFFWHAGENRGTQDCVDKARLMGIRVVEVRA